MSVPNWGLHSACVSRLLSPPPRLRPRGLSRLVAFLCTSATPAQHQNNCILVTAPSQNRMTLTSRSTGSHHTDDKYDDTPTASASFAPPLPPALALATSAGAGPPSRHRTLSARHRASITYDSAPYGDGCASKPQAGRSHSSNISCSRRGQAAARRDTTSGDSCVRKGQVGAWGRSKQGHGAARAWCSVRLEWYGHGQIWPT